MKKKIVFLIVALVLVVGAYSGYKYLYKDHRNIAEETAALTTNANEIQQLFSEGDGDPYLNKTVVITGTVTELETAAIILDGKVQCDLAPGTLGIEDGDEITVKGRCIGYDDLFELVKIDQSQRID
ncbi:MAG: hypothetical protein Aureis2KO_14720 [Aureisphaera sp.]